MTPYNHHISDTYLQAYGTELVSDLSEAHRGGSRAFRRSIARRLVQLGAWMLPEKPDMVNGTILVLEIEPDASAAREAA